MVEALDYNELNKKLEEKYDYDEQRVVGILLARYDIQIAQEIIKQCYQYWNLNTKKYLDIFWAGYGAYLPPADESPTKIILNYPWNSKRVYFDLEAFIEIKEQLNVFFEAEYTDRLQLVLVNYRKGKLHFDESIMIDLEENLDSNFARIREIMEFLSRECRSEHQVEPIANKLKIGHLKEIIKGITLSDIISTAIGVAGLGAQ